MPAKRPEENDDENMKATPSQRLRDIFRLPRRGSVRSANDNPAPMAWILKRGLSILVPLAAIAFLAAAVILGGR